jgi:hypothetical protein
MKYPGVLYLCILVSSFICHIFAANGDTVIPVLNTVDELIANGYVAKKLHLKVPMTEKELGVLRSFEHIRYVPGYAKPTYFGSFQMANLVRGDYSWSRGAREAYQSAEKEFMEYLLRLAKLVDLNTEDSSALLQKLLHVRERVLAQNSYLGARALHLVGKEAKRALYLFGNTGIFWYFRKVHPKIFMSSIKQVWDRELHGFWSFRAATRSKSVEVREHGFDKVMWHYVRGKYQEVMRDVFRDYLGNQYWGPEMMRHIQVLKALHAVFGE